MYIEEGTKLDFSDVLIRPKRSTLSSRKEVDLNRSFTFRNSKKTWSGIPIVAANMDGVGTFGVAKVLAKYNMMTCLTKHCDFFDWEENFSNSIVNNVAISIGTNLSAYEDAKRIIDDKSLEIICIDIANGYSEHFVDFVRKVREDYPNKILIAGNVVTADMTQELILAGADIVKVGIGPGSVCTTRIKTGVGYPQLSAVMECADAAHGLGGHIMSDGGCICPGDISKAFGAGADFVMLGGMLAGHTEGGGKIITKSFLTEEIDFKTGKQVVEIREFVKFYGMSSDTAMNKHSGGVANYRASEGRTVEVKFKGSLDPTISDMLGGIRSTCTYVGAEKLKHLSKCSTFILVNNQYNKSLI